MSRDPALDGELDRAIETGLREQPRSTGCPSMDVMGAYFERALAVDEVARWDEHFANCRYCQQVLAAMSRADPVTPPIESPSVWARAFDWKWLVPATAAATAVTIWIAVRAPSPSPAPALTAIQSREIAPSAPAPPAAAAEGQFAARAEKPAVSPANPAATDQTAQKKEAARGEPTSVELSDRTARRDAPPAGQAAGTAAPPPAAATAPTENRQALMESADAARERVAATIIAPGGAQWRVGPGGRVERSRDGGATWNPQSTGSNRDLLAGAAPSESVCWVVGRNGAILRTTDGQSWSAVDSPVTSDIVSVSATDEAHAVITTTDKQRFTTSDGGKTWQKQ